MKYSAKAITAGIFAGTVKANPLTGKLERFTNAFIDQLDADLFTKAALQLDIVAENAIADFSAAEQAQIQDAIKATI